MNRKKEAEKIKRFVRQYGQFPFKERKENYQDYYLGGEYVSGSRNVKHRYEVMKLPETITGGVLDLGCQIGSMLAEAYMRGARPCVGVDIQTEFLDCAKMIAKFNNFDITYLKLDITKDEAIKTMNNMFPNGIDIVFSLSIYKHIERDFHKLLYQLNYKKMYIEGHNAGNAGWDGDMNQRIEVLLKQTGYKWDRVAMSSCRSPRCIWIVRKEE
jgi:predicted RNA methylase